MLSSPGALGAGSTLNLINARIAQGLGVQGAPGQDPREVNARLYGVGGWGDLDLS